MTTKKLPLIGKGTFSKVYRLNEKEVLIKSNDPVKECMALFIDSFLLPKITRLDNNDYTMEYFAPVKSLKESLLPAQYELYKELRSLSVGCVNNSNNLYFEWRKQFETITNEDVKEDLLQIMDCLADYGSDISFEISPRNVAVKDGKLVLLDCFFLKGHLQQVCISKKKRQYNY